MNFVPISHDYMVLAICTGGAKLNFMHLHQKRKTKTELLGSKLVWLMSFTIERITGNSSK